MNEVVIRASKDEDVAALHAIYAHSVEVETASWEYEPPSLEEFAARRRGILDQGFPYLTAELNGLAVGYAYASSYRSRIGYRFVVENSVYVAKDVAGKGIGKKLMQALIEACEKKGFRQMVAVIGDSANIRSIKLHEACGFTHAALFKNIGFKQGRWLDSVQMQRPLGQGSATLP
jgi:L-amino acid N-acyltransferase YncA